ncbi:MAG: threonine-phosphate decarboxylase CobD [Oscillospiraceae bacterium]|nr:threonine-phosphate decarboxylase CobD [Oscillospiraceae bacterium]
MTHGGDIYAWGERKLLDFSASLNPLGMPSEVARAAVEGIAASDRYPDPQCRSLRRAIAETEGVSTEQIFCGNGAAELLDRLVLALQPNQAMLLAPTFGEYERALRMNGCKVFPHYLKSEREFDMTEDLLRVLRPGLDLFILCNPNNPTGRTIAAPLLEKICRRCQAQNTVLVVDESFLSLTDKAAQTDLRPLLAECPRLVLLRSLTKSYAMPGLRLGYLLCGDPALLERVAQAGQPWGVSVPAQYAGIAAMRRPDWPRLGREAVAPQRRRLTEELRKMGFRVWDSRANYLLFYTADWTDLRERLLERDILIRDCSGFPGLGTGYYRIAVRTEEENNRLLQALRELCKERRR